MKSILAARQKRKEEKLLQEKERAEIQEATRNFLQHPQLFGGGGGSHHQQQQPKRPIQQSSNNTNANADTPRLPKSESMTDLDDDDDDDDEDEEEELEENQQETPNNIANNEQSASEISYSSMERNSESRGSLGYGTLSPSTPQKPSLGASLRASLMFGMSGHSEHQQQSMDYKRQTSSQSLQIQSSEPHLMSNNWYRGTGSRDPEQSIESGVANPDASLLSSPTTSALRPAPPPKDMRKVDSQGNLTKLRAPSKDTRPYNRNNSAGAYNATHRRLSSTQKQHHQHQQQQQQPGPLRGREREPKRGNLQRTRSRSLSDLKVEQPSSSTSKQQQQQQQQPLAVPETPRTARSKKMMKRMSARGMEDKVEHPIVPETPRSRQHRKLMDNISNNNNNNRASSNMEIPPFPTTPGRTPKKKISAMGTNTPGRMPKPKISTNSSSAAGHNRNNSESQRSRNRTSAKDVHDCDQGDKDEVVFDPFATSPKSNKMSTTDDSRRHSLSATEYQVVNVSTKNTKTHRKDASSRTLGSNNRDSSENSGVPTTPKRPSQQRHSIGSKRGSVRNMGGQGTAATTTSPKEDYKAAAKKGREPRRGSLQRTRSRSRSLTDLRRSGDGKRQSTRKQLSTNRDLVDDLDITHRSSAMIRQLSARRFEDNCMDTAPAKSPQRIFTTRKINRGDENGSHDDDGNNQKLRTPSKSRRTRSDQDGTPNSILKTPGRRGKKKPPPLVGSLDGEDDSSDSDNEDEKRKRQSTTKNKDSAKKPPEERYPMPLVSQSLHISSNASLAGRTHAAASGWNMANKKKLKQWKTDLSSPGSSVTSKDVLTSAASSNRPKRRNSFTSVPSLASVHSRGTTTIMPALASVHSRDSFVAMVEAESSSERSELANRGNPSASATSERVLPTRDFNKTMDDHGRPGRMREMMHRTRSQSLSNLRAAAYPDHQANTKIRKTPSRDQNHTVDNTGRPSRAPIRGMLQRTRSRSLTDLFSGVRKETEPQSRPSAFGHMHRQNSRQRLLIDGDNENSNDGPQPLTVEQVSHGKKKKKKKKLPYRQESEPSGVFHKKKLPKRQESEPSVLVNRPGNLHTSMETKRQLIGSMHPSSKSHLQDYMRKDETAGRKGSSVSGTRSTQSASTASFDPQKRGRAAPGKRRGIPRQRSRSLTDFTPRDRRGSKKPPLTATNNAPVRNGTSLDVSNHAEGFAEVAFSVFSTMAKGKTIAEKGRQSSSELEFDRKSDAKNIEKSPGANAQGSIRARRAPTDRCLSRHRSRSLTNLQPRLKAPLDDTDRTDRTLLLFSTQEERDISRLKKKIVTLQKELKSVESTDIGSRIPHGAIGAEEGLDAQATYLISYFEEENDKERAQIRSFKEKIFDLRQENAKLVHGTEQTKKYYSELEAIDNAEVMKYEALQKNVPTFQGIVEAHEAKLERRIRRINFERKTAQHYRDNTGSIIRDFQDKCDDPELVRTLEELADL